MAELEIKKEDIIADKVPRKRVKTSFFQVEEDDEEKEKRKKRGGKSQKKTTVDPNGTHKLILT